MMKIFKKTKTKRILSILGLIIACLFVFKLEILDQQTAFADTDWFRLEEGEDLSFVQYEGQLADLSAEGYDPTLTQSSDFREFVIGIVNFALGFLGLLAVIIVIYGGVLYVTAAGEEENTQKGKKAITYATIGILIIMGSFAFVNTILSAPGDGSQNTGRTTVGVTGGGFNAFGERVRAIAQDIFSGFEVLDESTLVLKGIQQDANDPSISPSDDKILQQANILSFLFNTRTRLIEIKTSVPQFSQAAAEINSILLEIDQDIAKIENNPNYRQYIGKEEDRDSEQAECVFSFGTSGCDEEGVFDGEEPLNRSQAEQRCPAPAVLRLEDDNEVWACYRGPHEVWGESWAKYSSDNSRISNLVEPIRDDYVSTLYEAFIELEEINFALRGVPALAADGSPARTAFLAFKNSSAYGFQVGQATAEDDIELISDYLNPSNTTSVQTIEEIIFPVNGGFFSEIINWDINTTASTAGPKMGAGLEAQGIYHEELTETEFVQARLTADVIEGNAPLTVLFDALATSDPAGGSLRGGNIIWDIAGSQTSEELYTNNNFEENLLIDDEFGDAVFCDFTSTFNTDSGSISNQENEDDVTKNELLGSTAQRCTFTRPGTYNVAIKVQSNEPTQYAPGVSVLTIVVRPPATEINYKVCEGSCPSSESAAGSGLRQYTISRYENNVQIINRSRIEVLTSIAEAGLTFDAGSTQAELFKWDFDGGDADDQYEEFLASNDIAQDVKFTAPGRYKVELEVVSPIGVRDRHILTVVVSGIIASIDLPLTSERFINQPLTFSGSNSRSETGGAIRSYEWSIVNRVSGQSKEYSGEVIEHTFEEPGEYDITLTVQDESNDTTTSTETISIKSQPPVAQFTYSIPNESQPGTVYLDPDTTFDPDGENENLSFQWEVDGDAVDDTDYEFIENNPRAPIIKFNEVGEYEVTLEVTDISTVGTSNEESDSITKTIVIDKVLDVAWAETQESTSILNEEGKSQVDFEIITDNGVAYEIDFGDGDVSVGETNRGGVTTIPHTYTEGGKYTVNVTVFDDEDNDTTIQRRFFIGGGENPIAKINLLVNGVLITDLTDPVEVSRRDILTLDGSSSRNTDGTGRKLVFGWNFGDTEQSASREATHSYNELSPEEPGYFTVRLQVTDQDDPTLIDTDEIRIRVVSEPPKFSSIQAIPASREAELVTPVRVNVRAFGVDDPDGTVSQYRWWYFDLDDPDEPLGMQITTSSNAQLTIGTNGQEGQEITYGFGLEITDDDGLKFSSEEIFNTPANAPSVEVTNGPNDLPTARFNVNTTSTFTGGKVVFTSASEDPDGNIVRYIWDFEGDGFFNNTPTDQATVEYIYEDRNLEGYDVRLKVIDDKGGESISSPVTVYVDALSEPPVAAFNYEIVEGSAGKRVRFTNNSSADIEAGAEIIQYTWDFDTNSSFSSADSDGDGIKSNDSDSTQVDPSRLYTEYGVYTVQLTVTDNQGNSDTVTQTINLVSPAVAPTAAFTYNANGQSISFVNNSTSSSELILSAFAWDFDIQTDSNGDGDPTNDINSTSRNPVTSYPEFGEYNVKLTVTDSNGNQDSVTNPVQVLPQGSVAGEELRAILITIPAAAADNFVYLPGRTGQIIIDFSQSEGAISQYTIDKNIYFDTDGDGNPSNDRDFRTPLPGKWTTNFDSTWGKTVIKLTVEDIYGNISTATREIKYPEE